MKAADADTIYREIVRRSSVAGLAYLREQLAAHEAKGFALCRGELVEALQVATGNEDSATRLRPGASDTGHRALR